MQDFSFLLSYFNTSEINNVPVYTGVAGQSRWRFISVNLKPEQTTFVIEAVRGGRTEAEDQGDLCIDNVAVYGYECGACMLTS